MLTNLWKTVNKGLAKTHNPKSMLQPLTGAFLEIEVGGCSMSNGAVRTARGQNLHPALIRPCVFRSIVIANADCACSIGRGHDL